MPSYRDFRPAFALQPALAISADGAFAAYADDRSGQFNLIVQPVAGGPARPVTSFTSHTVRRMAWHPDGQSLFFQADLHGNEDTQIYCVGLDGSQPRQLTDYPQARFHLGSGDTVRAGKLAYSGGDRIPTAQDVSVLDLETQDIKRLFLGTGPTDAASFSPDGTRLSLIEWCNGYENLVHVAEVDGTGSLALTPLAAAATYELGPWLPDGSGFLVCTDYGREFTGLAVMSASTGALTWIDTPDWDVEQVALSADGTTLAWLVNVDGASELRVRPLTAALSTASEPSSSEPSSSEPSSSELASPSGLAASELASSKPAASEPASSSGPSSSELAASELAASELAASELAASSGFAAAEPASSDHLFTTGSSSAGGSDSAADSSLVVPELPLGQGNALALAPDGSYAAMLMSTPTRPWNVLIADLRGGGLRWLTDSAPTGASVTMTEARPVRYPTHDGRSIAAYVYLPSEMDRPLGAVICVHGGPVAQERPIYVHEGLYQYLVSRGVAVIAPNIRGSSGYGTSFEKLIYRDWGGGDLGDLAATARFLTEQPWADPKRIGLYGGSYGGFAVLSCVARLPELGWAAAVDICGPSNLLTLAEATPPTFRDVVNKIIGDPETDADELRQRSPITYADQIKAPLFVLQGANDPRVPQRESDQLVERLRARGVPVRYDIYPDEGHGFTKTENQIKARSDAADFLIAHLT